MTEAYAQQAAAPSSRAHARKRPSYGRRSRSTPGEAPSDTFLQGESSTCEQFLRSVKDGVHAAEYYSEYLSVPPARVVETLSEGLAITALKGPGSFTEYRRHSNGVIYPVRVELAAGTRILQAMDGKVSLLAANGDPIIPFAMVVNVVRAVPPIPEAPPVEVIVAAPEREVIDRGDQTPGTDVPPKE